MTAGTITYMLSGGKWYSPGREPISAGLGPDVQSVLPNYISPEPIPADSGSYVQAFRRLRTEAAAQGLPGPVLWPSAFYTYWPGDMGAFNSDWVQLTGEYPDGLPVLGSPKGAPESNPGAVTGFFDQMPQPWRDKFICAYWQEPGNDFGGSGQPPISTYRTRVSAMADLVRPYGVINASHVEEWDINPFNNSSGANFTERAAHLGQFVQGIEDKIDYMSWSLYPAEGKSMTPGLDRIRTWMEQYMPGKSWGVTASGSPVQGSAPIGGSERELRGQIVEDAADYIAQMVAATGGKGPLAFGWFDFDEFNPGRDQLVSKDPRLQQAMDYVSNTQIPGSLPWQ